MPDGVVGDSKPRWPLRQEAGGFRVVIAIQIPSLVWEIYVFVAGTFFFLLMGPVSFEPEAHRIV